MPLIEPGKKAPAFTLKDQSGKTHRLADYAGRPVILYFYPKDDTPGCTKEACAFRDNLPKFKPSKAAILGVSILDEASKAKFARKYDLNFPLLADADHAVAEKYGVWQEKSNYGKTYMGIARTTYVIGPDRAGNSRAIRPGTDKELREAAARSRYVPRAVQRAVWRRDGGQCAFVSKDGRRCTERTFLEFHHIWPYAKKGPPTVENISLPLSAPQPIRGGADLRAIRRFDRP